jgi:hypothetical protein
MYESPMDAGFITAGNAKAANGEIGKIRQSVLE